MNYKILHVVDHTGAGGAQVFLYNSIRLLKDSYDFSIAVLGHEGLFSDKLRDLGIPIYTFGRHAAVWNPFSLLPLIRLIRSGGFKIIHAQLYKSYIIAGIAARLTGTKLLIHDQTGIYSDSLKHYFRSSAFRWVYLTAYRLIIRKQCHVVALTQFTVDYYRNRYDLRHDAVTLLPNAVDLSEFDFKKCTMTPVVSYKTLPPGSRKIIMIARLAHEKDWPTFIDVAKKVHDRNLWHCWFFIVGTGPEEERLRKLVLQQQIKNVIFLGYREDVPELLCQSDIFILTSRREPFGIAAIEAMAAGCPVVAARSEGPSSYINHGKNGFLTEIGDSEAMSKHVVELLDDMTLAKRIGNEAKNDVARRFSIGPLTCNLTDVYEKISKKTFK